MRSEKQTVPPCRDTENIGGIAPLLSTVIPLRRFRQARVRSLTTVGCEPCFTVGCYHIININFPAVYTLIITQA